MALPFLTCSARRLDETVRDELLCVFDFDGALAPVAALDEQPRVPLGMVLRLAELSSYAQVAVVSRRSEAEIENALGFKPDFVAGRVGGGTANTDGKQSALERLLRTSGAHNAVCVGAEDLFGMSRRNLLSVRIGQALDSAAEFFLPHRLDMFALLDNLLHRLRHARKTDALHVAPVRSRLQAPELVCVPG